jgi:diguanylate cyclase (GGDEF)-like protein
VRRWPAGHFVDYLLISGRPSDGARNQRVLDTADAHVRVTEALSDVRSSKESAERRLTKASAQIKEISSALSEGLVKELEKRIVLEKRYIRFREQKRKFEDTLRKLYAANDVSNLLDIVVEIKDLIGAEGISLYIREENDVLGKYLKPLVWDDAFLSHADFARYVAPLPAQDFAAFVGRTGQEINIAEAGRDPRLSHRYQDHLRNPLRNIIGAPLRQNSEVIGLIEAVNKTGSDAARKAGFTAEDQQILRALSEHISLAMAKLNLIQYDALTGLLRPDPFFEKASQKILFRAKRRQETGVAALVMGDVDWFKAYHDRNGHEAGNRLLRELAGVLKASIREDDLLCRYGGEEFLFYLSDVKNLEEATLLTERMRKNVEERAFEFEEFQPRHDLTMSFGVTTLSLDRLGAGGLATKAQLKKAANEADMALAEAKGKKLAALKGSGAEIDKNKVCAYVRDKAVVVTDTSLLRGATEPPFREKRKFARHAAMTLCIFRENGAHRVANTLDLSLGGTQLSSKTLFAPARILDLFLVLGNKATPLSGMVVYSRKAAADYYFTGIKFRNPAAGDIDALEAYFASLESSGTALD